MCIGTSKLFAGLGSNALFDFCKTGRDHIPHNKELCFFLWTLFQ